MLTSGDVVTIDLGTPIGREAGLRRPAVVVTADRVLEHRPTVVQVVPLTSTVRGFGSEVTIEPDAANRLALRSSAQCQHVRAISPERITSIDGNVGPAAVRQIRDTIALILDLPS